MDRFITTEELAEMCRTSPSTVAQWRLKGTGPRGAKIGRRVLYDRRDVEAWLESAVSASA